MCPFVINILSSVIQLLLLRNIQHLIPIKTFLSCVQSRYPAIFTKTRADSNSKILLETGLVNGSGLNISLQKILVNEFLWPQQRK